VAEIAHAWRRVRRGLAAIIAALLIAAAAAMALGQLLVPLIARYPQEVAALLASRLHEPVSIAAVAGEWQPSGPLLSVRDLRIGTGSAALALPHAQLKIDLGAWLKPSRRWLELRVTGMRAQLTRDAQGHWRVGGFGGTGGTGEDFDGSLPVDLLLRDFSLGVDDVLGGRRFELQVPQLRVVGRRGRLRLGGIIGGIGDAPLQIAAEIDPLRRNARFYLAGKDLDLAAWSALATSSGLAVQRGRGDVRLWLDWQDAALQSASAELQLDDVALERDSRHVEVPAWQGIVHLAREDGGWQADYRNTAAAGESASAWWRSRNGHVQATLDATTLDVAQLAPWLPLLPALPATAADWLHDAAPHGRIADAHIAWNDTSDFRLRATLDSIGFTAAHRVPGVDHVSGELRGDGAAVMLALPAQSFTVSVPGVFRKPFAYSRVTGTLAAWPAAAGWRIGTDRIEFDGEGYAGSLRGDLTVPGDGAPVLDVAAVATQAVVPAAKLFWPVNVMPPPAVTWLDRALVSGNVEGRAIFRGPLDGFPFKDASGRFEAVGEFHDTVLDFHPDWPRAEGLAGRASFIDNGMDVEVSGGSSLGNAADSASGRIADFDHAVLELVVASHGSAARMLAYLRKTPIGKHFGAALDGMTVDGPAKAGFTLQLPLHDGPDQDVSLDGNAELQGDGFEVPEWSLELDKLAGALHFSADALDGDGFSATYHGTPVTLAVKVGSAVADTAHQLEADMRGRFDAATLLNGYDSVAPLAAMTQGAADFDIGLDIDSADDLQAGARRLHIVSDLRGMALDLPAPLDKATDAVLPLALDVGLPFEGSELSLSLDNLLDARLHLADADKPLGADIALGGTAVAADPGSLRVHGDVDTLDISGWLAHALGGTGTADSHLVGVDVVATHAMVDQRDLGKLSLKLAPQDGGYQLVLAGDAAVGSISLPGTDLAQRGITAKLDKLYWPEGDDNAEAPAAGNGVAPAALPPLHLWVRDLRLGSARLGEVRFESVPVDNGMQVEQLDAQSSDVQVSARGRWSGDASASATHMAIDFSSGDLGRMLDAFGYPGLVAGGTTLAHIDGSWPGAPSAFSLAALDGSMKVHVEDGRILDVEPGVGRLFGLFSIRELPRRLSLDFGDIFKSGFSFNSIDGHFAFADGNAHTDDLAIRGPSAAIDLRGRTGLKAKDYDQDIEVIPHVGVALPVVGAIAGGPVGAAAGLAVQTLIGKGLNRAAAAHYKITGSWAKPVITLVSRERPRAAPGPAPAASSATKDNKNK
jgi:uncharacterized protein (TIGR02099 family)